MNAQTSKGVANRLGYGLGLGVRFFLQDENPTLRWLKRAVFFILVGFVVAQAFTWLASAFLSVACVGLVAWALSKSDATQISVAMGNPTADDAAPPHQSQDDAMWRDGPEGWGYYRADDVRLDF
ncbi:DUF3742 family protein [Pseudomonas protegens]|uniref:DUF3742 family protein n=1 Tax=Pseudomonas protegens TaxID=380021 RepID=UPI00380505C0